MMLKNNSLNITLDIARCFALLSVVAAHLDKLNNETVQSYWTYFSCIGVVLFFILSGYFFKPEKYNSVKELLCDKGKAIGLPWLVMGTCYFVGLFAFGFLPLTPGSYLKTILGFKSMFYYLTSLSVFYIVFYFLRNCKKRMLILIISIVFTVAMIIINWFDVLKLWQWDLNNLFIPFAWVGYFAVGNYFRSVDKTKIQNVICKTRLIWIVLFIVSGVTKAFYYDSLVLLYFTPFTIPYEVIGVMGIISVSSFKFFDNGALKFISKLSFGIYFIHPFLAQMLSRYYTLHISLEILSPFIVIIASVILLYFGYIIAKLIKIDRLYCMLTGIRMSRKIENK